MLASPKSMFVLVLFAAMITACGETATSVLPGSRQPAVDAIFAEYDSPSSPGCALGVIQDGELIYGRGYGMADLERGAALDADSVFRIASVSKQFTAMTVLLLDEAGTLSLDDDIRDWLPEIPDFGDVITIRHLLHHTSGLRDYLALTALAGYRDEDYYDASELLGLLARQRDLNFRPGAEFLYSNSGYFLLGQIVERASERSLGDAADELIFGPLGMRSTHFHDDAAHLVPRRALGFAPEDGGGFVLSMTTLPITGDGSVFTSVNDLLAWDRNFYDNRLGNGDPRLIQRWLAGGVLNDGTVIPYGSGIVTREYRGLPMVGHGGAFVGFRADMIRFPAQRFGVITLCNLSTAGPAALARRVADRYLGDVMGPAPDPDARGSDATGEDPGKESLLPVAELRGFAGRYRSAELDVIYEIAVREGRLVASIPYRLEWELRPAESDRFVAGERGRQMVFRFARNSRGAMTGLMVDAGRVVNLWFDRID